MNKEMADRIREAGNYQKKAIHALFPDRTNRHFEVIEHEIREMITEEAVEIAGMVMQYQTKSSDEKEKGSTSKESEAQTGTSKSKKINIE